MKIALEVSNKGKAIRPSTNNVIIYDGKQWYVTTKTELFKEYDEKFTTKLEECEEKLAEIKAFQKEIAAQMVEYGEIIKAIVLKESE